MKIRVIIITCLLAGVAVQAQNKLPQGKWAVEQVTIEKNTDGNLQTTVYNTAAEVKSYIPCPQEWEIGTENILLRYSDGSEESTALAFEGNKLKIAAAGALQLYNYSITGNTLTLTITHNYRYNNPEGQMERIEEKWTIILKK